VELPCETPRYEDDEVVLTGYGLEDVDDHLAGEDEETARQFGWWPKRSTAEMVAAAFGAWAQDWAHDGPTRAFAVRDRRTGGLLGGCELRRHDDGPFTVSYWTGAEHRRRGVATRALRLLLLYAEDESVTDIACDVAVDNVAYRRVAEAGGFSHPTLHTDPDARAMVRLTRDHGQTART
jgi:RimJ/RimL family protein N-acetyltransferase